VHSLSFNIAFPLLKMLQELMQQSDTLRNTQCPPKVLSNDIRGHVDMVCQGDFIMHRLPDV